jgi:hypothetical protein
MTSMSFVIILDSPTIEGAQNGGDKYSHRLHRQSTAKALEREVVQAQIP